MEVDRSLVGWGRNLFDSGLELDEETTKMVEFCLGRFAEIYPVLISSFGPMNRKRTQPPVLAFFDVDNQSKLRLCGDAQGLTEQGSSRLANRFVRGGGWIAYDFMMDVIGIGIEGQKIAKLSEWSAALGIKEDDFLRYALIEETTHACLYKYPLVSTRPVNENPQTYAGLVERMAKILGQGEVILDPAEFWVGFGIGLVEPVLRKVNDKVLSKLLVYITDIESGKRKPDKYLLMYAAAHLTTRAAFDLIGDRDVRTVLLENPTLLTEPNKLIENFVLPVKVRIPV